MPMNSTEEDAFFKSMNWEKNLIARQYELYRGEELVAYWTFDDWTTQMQSVAGERDAMNIVRNVTRTRLDPSWRPND